MGQAQGLVHTPGESDSSTGQAGDKNHSTIMTLGLKISLISSILIIQGLSLAAQNQEDVTDVHHGNDAEHSSLGHKITLVMAYSFIDNSFLEENDAIRIVPTFGFNYDYFFHARWGFGIHTDILLQQYKVEKHGSHEEILRENPVGIAGMVLFKPNHRWTLMAGYGVEVEKHENFQMVRTGVEYGIALPKHWELGFSLEFDYKINTHNSIMFGVAFSKILGRKNKTKI